MNLANKCINRLVVGKKPISGKDGGKTLLHWLYSRSYQESKRSYMFWFRALVFLNVTFPKQYFILASINCFSNKQIHYLNNVLHLPLKCGSKYVSLYLCSICSFWALNIISRMQMVLDHCQGKIGVLFVYLVSFFTSHSYRPYVAN